MCRFMLQPTFWSSSREIAPEPSWQIYDIRKKSKNAKMTWNMTQM